MVNPKEPIDILIGELPRLSEDDIENWRNRAKGVLRGALGQAHPSVKEMEEVASYAYDGTAPTQSGKTLPVGFSKESSTRSSWQDPQ